MKILQVVFLLLLCSCGSSKKIVSEESYEHKIISIQDSVIHHSISTVIDSAFINTQLKGRIQVVDFDTCGRVARETIISFDQTKEDNRIIIAYDSSSTFNVKNQNIDLKENKYLVEEKERNTRVIPLWFFFVCFIICLLFYILQRK